MNKPTLNFALVHDYLTQRGGAERVVLSLARAFPSAPLYTSLYAADETFPEFASLDVRTLPLNVIAPLRQHHRLALPLLAPSFSRACVAARVVVCSSSGWAHGVRVEGRKIVYCHTPARWLYQPDRYLKNRNQLLHGAAKVLRPWLVRWDKAAAASADRYLANSSIVAERIREEYGVEAEVVPPPPALTPDGPMRAVDGVTPGFVLCVSRLLAYKNVDAVVRAFSELRGEFLVVAGSGPNASALRAVAGPNVMFVGRVSDAELRWLYGNCTALVAASHEDFGLAPLEAASFAKPVAVLRWGGFLDTVSEGTTGVFFDAPAPRAVADAVRELRRIRWDDDAIRRHAGAFSEARFAQRMNEIGAEELALAGRA